MAPVPKEGHGHTIEETSEEQVDPVFLQLSLHDSTITLPGAIDNPLYTPHQFHDLPMEGDSERTDTSNLALNMLQPGAALLAQDCGSGSAPESPIFHMPGLPQILHDNNNIASPTVAYFTPLGAPRVSDPCPTASQPDIPTLPSQINSPTPLPPAAATPGNQKQCPACGLKLSRWQDCDRHISTHLPHWIHCPLSQCAWRGNRIKSIKLHWKRQDHLKYHESYGHILRREQFEIFDPQLFVNRIKAGTSVNDAASQALLFVDMKAVQLHKSIMWENPWGYKLKATPQLVSPGI